MLTISKIDSFEELLKLENRWNDLIKESNTNTIFLTFDWISVWWRYFGKEKGLFVLIVEDEGRIVGIAPLMVISRKIFGKEIKKMELIGMPLSDYSDFIIEKNNTEAIDMIYSYLERHKDSWSYIKLNNIPQDSPTLNQSKEHFRSKKLFNLSHSETCLSLVFNDEWEEPKRKMNNKSWRKKIRIFERIGSLSFLRCNSDTEEKLKILSMLIEQHKRKWNKTPTPSMFNEEHCRFFFMDIIEVLSKKEKAELFYINCNKKPVAFMLTFILNNKCLLYTTSYDIDYGRLSPGLLLHKFLSEECASQGLREIDFSRGAEGYKKRFSNNIRHNFSISIHQNMFLYILDNISNMAEQKIKQNEKVKNFFMKYEKKLRLF